MTISFRPWPPSLRTFQTNGTNQLQRFSYVPQQVQIGNVPLDELRDDYYGGCVLTFLDGNARGRSTRVVNFKPSNRNAQIVIEGVMVPNAITGELLPPQAGSRFIINGRPFNGVGAGYNPATGAMDNPVTASVPVPTAYFPNYTAYRDSKTIEEITYGGLDESWDAVDFQNLFLAKAATAAINVANANTSDDDEEATPNAYQSYMASTGGNTPSFHRPYLLAYLAQRVPGILDGATLRRALIFRPDREDHPGFTGSNPGFDPISGPWDVDNDGDGIPDSIWMDFGLSPLTGPDGRLYKPLVAPLIIDLDGRINLNTADSLEHKKAVANLSTFASNNTIVSGAVNLSSEKNYFGFGFGPADIGLPINASVIRSRYAGSQTLNGKSEGFTFGVSPATSSAWTQWDEPATPGRGPVTGTGFNASTNSDDDYELRQRNQASNGFVPDLYMGLSNSIDQVRDDRTYSWTGNIQGTLETGYGSPIDLFGRGIPYLDPSGNMLVANVGLFDSLDDPYEITPLQRGTEDNLYSLSDLEFLLRYDANETRATSRLDQFGVFFTDLEELTTRTYTTRSASIPTPPAVQSTGLAGRPLARSVRDMFAAKVQRELQRTGVEGDPYALVDQLDLVPPELARGEKLNVNRFLTANRPQHLAEPDAYWAILEEKANFARQLFHLMMLVTDETFLMPTLETVDPVTRYELHVRRIAQWAINVVDFGDADSVMTPFVYDARPFNANRLGSYDPRNPDIGNPDFRVIWGMEHPELVLTETLAFHDRRVEDTKNETGGSTRTDRVDPDPDLDQAVPPEGSLFVELLCVRGDSPRRADLAVRSVASRGPEDLYGYVENQMHLNLEQVPLNSMKPVWRLAIGEIREPGDTNTDVNPDHARFERPDSTTF